MPSAIPNDKIDADVCLLDILHFWSKQGALNWRYSEPMRDCSGICCYVYSAERISIVALLARNV